MTRDEVTVDIEPTPVCVACDVLMEPEYWGATRERYPSIPMGEHPRPAIDSPLMFAGSWWLCPGCAGCDSWAILGEWARRTADTAWRVPS